MIRYIFLIAAVTFLSGVSIANNIQVSAPTLTGENRTDGYVYVTFDLSWANSWRGTEANNWDAAWVFVKYRVGTGEWKHAKLHNSGHIVGSGTPATLDVGLRDDKSPFEPAGNPGVGAFIYRSAEGFGTFNTTANKLRWNYTAEGITTGATVEVRVFAIEMVYVREGEFNVGGGGGGGDNSFISTTINTPDARVTPSGVGSLGGMAGGYPSGVNNNSTQVDIQPMNSDWPNGFEAFYCMKYEISQQQYVEFLRCLTAVQLSARLPTGGSFRFGIQYFSVGNVSTIYPDLPCNNLSWEDMRAFVDWSCLRPMSELEYEKACRGVLPPVYGEYPWGNADIIAKYEHDKYSISNGGAENENISDGYSATEGNANHAYSNPYSLGVGPFRVGIFAANGANTGRVTSGGSYWGIMDLSGNLWEGCVYIGSSAGKSFRDKNGDGLIGELGNCNENSWPNSNINDIILRGGSFGDGPTQVSSRNIWYFPINREPWGGYRAVRSN